MTTTLDRELTISKTSRRSAVVPALVVLVLTAALLTWWLASRPAPVDVLPAVEQDGSYTVGTIPGDGEAAVKAAAAALPEALSYDFRTLDNDLNNATGHMTGSFAKEFRTTFDKTARPLALAKQAVMNASVRGAGLVHMDGDRHAVVLLYVDQLLVSSNTAKGDPAPVKVSQNRVVVELRLVGGTWKLDAINPL
jgi:hypothetical protein